MSGALGLVLAGGAEAEVPPTPDGGTFVPPPGVLTGPTPNIAFSPEDHSVLIPPNSAAVPCGFATRLAIITPVAIITKRCDTRSITGTLWQAVPDDRRHAHGILR